MYNGIDVNIGSTVQFFQLSQKIFCPRCIFILEIQHASSKIFIQDESKIHDTFLKITYKINYHISKNADSEKHQNRQDIFTLLISNNVFFNFISLKSFFWNSFNEEKRKASILTTQNP